MEKSLQQELRDKLEEEKKRLSSLLQRMTGDTEFDKNKVQMKWKEVGDKEEDNATEWADYQDSISVEHKLEENLEEINAALKRMDEGTYGVCEVSGEDIEPERLRVNPTATVCLACAKKK